MVNLFDERFRIVDSSIYVVEVQGPTLLLRPGYASTIRKFLRGEST